ncbi:hypothetical protein C8J57DRAFT_229539 [Mycena rebaudengoi]|nr:hypothetical protein C8J57DRAFT_229539 [Mycena rebaudengoi]
MGHPAIMQSIRGPCGPPPTRVRRLLLLGAVLALSSTALIHYSVRGGGHEWWADNGRGGYAENINSNYNDEYEYASAQTPGENASPFFRDPHPALHAQRFLKQAQKEIRARRDLDTCGGKLGERMVDAYLASALSVCTPESPTQITCFPGGAALKAFDAPIDAQNAWWPYPRAPCISHNIAHTPAWGDAGAFAGNCARLATAMGRERWVGMGFEETAGEYFSFFLGGASVLHCTIVHPPFLLRILVLIPRSSSAFPSLPSLPLLFPALRYRSLHLMVRTGRIPAPSFVGCMAGGAQIPLAVRVVRRFRWPSLLRWGTRQAAVEAAALTVEVCWHTGMHAFPLRGGQKSGTCDAPALALRHSSFSSAAR